MPSRDPPASAGGLTDPGPARDAESAELDVLRKQVRRQASELDRLQRRLTELRRQIREHGAGRLIADDST